MNRKIFWLRIAYWWGIIADTIMAVLMLFPQYFIRFTQIDLEPDMNLGYGLRYGVPLMLGWTLLLFWANRKPLERQNVLLITLTVIIGYIIIEAYDIANGLASVIPTLPVLILQLTLMALIIFSCYSNRPSDSETKAFVAESRQ